MSRQTIGIAMSGGVDSTASAILLKQQYALEGFFMDLNQPRFQEQKEKVQSIADRLNINLNVIDLRQDFEALVLDYFSDTYFSGQTPNPCVVCNQQIKFGLFLENILSRGLEKMATGHYAKCTFFDGRYHLLRGTDRRKDQSYFLSRLDQKQLSQILFPLGELTKEAIYQFVEQHGFDNFRGLESQDVCFLEDTQVSSYLNERQEQAAGEGAILSSSGKKLGVHNGLFRYTIGQRRGLGISSDSPLYVIRLDSKQNAVIVGKDEELFSTHLKIKDLHWLSGNPPDLEKNYTVAIRYSHKGSTAKLELSDCGGKIIFKEPQRAVTPGQFAAVYCEDELLGSGIIQ